MTATLIALNVFCGFIGMTYGSKFIAAINFAVAAFLIAVEVAK